MDNNSQHKDNLPPIEYKTPNTHKSNEFTPDFFNKLLKVALPEFNALDHSLLMLMDGQYAVLADIQHQLEFIQSVALPVDESNFIEIKASVLHGVSESLLKQTGLIHLFIGEVHHFVKNQDAFQQQKITALEGTIKQLEQDIALLKGGAK